MLVDLSPNEIANLKEARARARAAASPLRSLPEEDVSDDERDSEDDYSTGRSSAYDCEEEDLVDNSNAQPEYISQLVKYGTYPLEHLKNLIHTESFSQHSATSYSEKTNDKFRIWGCATRKPAKGEKGNKREEQAEKKRKLRDGEDPGPLELACPFRVFAKPTGVEDEWQIRTVEEKHTCRPVAIPNYNPDTSYFALQYIFPPSRYIYLLFAPF